jgi:hypothetical protein
MQSSFLFSVIVAAIRESGFEAVRPFPRYETGKADG